MEEDAEKANLAREVSVSQGVLIWESAFIAYRRLGTSRHTFKRSTQDILSNQCCASLGDIMNDGINRILLLTI